MQCQEYCKLNPMECRTSSTVKHICNKYEIIGVAGVSYKDGEKEKRQQKRIKRSWKSWHVHQSKQQLEGMQTQEPYIVEKCTKGKCQSRSNKKKRRGVQKSSKEKSMFENGLFLVCNDICGN